MLQEIKQAEKEALTFAKNVFGEALADAMYLGTYNASAILAPSSTSGMPQEIHFLSLVTKKSTISCHLRSFRLIQTKT